MVTSVRNVVAAFVTLGFAGVAVGATPDLPRPGVDRQIASWRAQVGRTHPVVASRRAAVLRAPLRALAQTGAHVLRASVVASPNGPAVYLDVLTSRPSRTLRASSALIAALTSQQFGGVWAVRVRDRTGGTVWVAWHVRNSGMVWPRQDLDAVSPISHSEPARLSPLSPAPATPLDP